MSPVLSASIGASSARLDIPSTISQACRSRGVKVWGASQSSGGSTSSRRSTSASVFMRPNVKRSEPVSVSRPMVVRSSPKNPEASPLRKLASASPASRVRAKTARANVSGDPKWRTTSPRGSTSAIRTTMLARPPIVPHTSETPSALAAFPCRVSS